MRVLEVVFRVLMVYRSVLVCLSVCCCVMMCWVIKGRVFFISVVGGKSMVVVRMSLVVSSSVGELLKRLCRFV